MPVVKNEEEELPVPTEWRQTFVGIVESFKDGDFSVYRRLDSVEPTSEEDAQRIAANIADYGGELVTLPEETWSTSIYRWMGNHWQVLVDLSTLDEGVSDLVLFARVREHLGGYRFVIDSVHVP